jgi:hypothetical protein
VQRSSAVAGEGEMLVVSGNEERRLENIRELRENRWCSNVEGLEVMMAKLMC